MTQFIALGTAVMFLTRLPVGRYASGDGQVLAQAVRYFPLVGLIVALVMGCTLWLCNLILPVNVAVVLALLVGVLVTGAFHEDGLADLADSAGAFDVSRKLDIMRDSRIGTYGASGLILCMLLRFMLISELTVHGICYVLGALVLAHASSRWSSAYLMARVDYARTETANKVVAQGVDNTVLLQATLCLFFIVILPAVLISPWAYLVLVAAWLTTLACSRFFQSVFNGITGDCLGAANVIVELTCLIVILASARMTLV